MSMRMFKNIVICFFNNFSQNIRYETFMDLAEYLQMIF